MRPSYEIKTTAFTVFLF